MSSADCWTMTVGEQPIPPATTRSRLAGTPQQEAFWARLVDDRGGLLLQARAGTGKSASCREGMWRLIERGSRPRIRYCCFNKAIADEFREKCPAGVEVGTMHSFGFQTLRSYLSDLKVEPNRSYQIMDRLGLRWGKSFRKAVSQLVSLAKNHALLPSERGRLHDLLTHYQVETWDRDEEVIDWSAEVLARSVEVDQVVDFDDMLWLPAYHEMVFPEVDLLFIDECQDLNPVQHELAMMMATGGRAVVVGDDRQAIYGFRGAATDSMNVLQGRLQARVLPLTVSFRCPRRHVELAREIVPDFEAHQDAPDGTLVRSSVEALGEARDGDLVLSRRNAPLVSRCLDLIASHRRANMRGRAFSDQLSILLRKVEPGARTVFDLLKAIEAWKVRELTKLAAIEGSEDAAEQVEDKAACLSALAGSCQTPGEVPGVIRRLFEEADPTNRVTFSTIHRAKGSEAERVYLLDEPYDFNRDRLRPPPAWEVLQRANLRYVALTRSLDSLTIISI